MNKHTKNNLLICTGMFLIFVGFFTYNLYKINGQGAKLSESRKVISDNLAKEVSYNKIMSLLDSTKTDRALLDNFFFTEKDTVHFISDMENDAKTIGVKMETNSLSVTKPVVKDGQVTDPAKLVLAITFSGSEDLVKKYVLLLESVPYQKTIPELGLSKIDDHSWQGRATLNITMAP